MHQHQQKQPLNSPPAEAHIQTWAPANETVAPQPQPPRANALQNMWNPELGIKFGGDGGPASPAPGGMSQHQQQQQQQMPPQHQQQQHPPAPASGTWNPSSGIRFG